MTRSRREFPLPAAAALLAAVCLGGISAAPAQDAPYRSPSRPVDARVDDLLGRLTLDEKLTLLGGGNFNTLPIERLGIPKFMMSDGPVGARSYGPSTAYTAAVALAASWNTDLAARVGVALGRDCRARGVHILLGPGVNLYRAPMCGRNFEYLGEDPLLAGTAAASYIRGLQSQGVAATLKHFAANNQDADRHGLSSDVDERTLRELYLRTFQIALRDGQPECMMTSYNLINGVHASANRHLNVDILKGELGFAGLLMSDWASCYDTIGMALGGMDLEMPSARFYQPENVRALLDQGVVTTPMIDDKIRRLLRLGFRMGWFDRDQTDASIPRDDPASAQVALDEAREGIVLLRNRDNLLPLHRERVRRIVLLGPNADRAMTGGGGSSFTTPFHSVSLPAGLKKLAADPASVVVANWKLAYEPPEETRKLLHDADAVVVCVGFDGVGVDQPFIPPPQGEGESFDRKYDLPPGTPELIRAAAQINPRTIVVLNAGGSVATADWIDAPAAILHAFYPGQEGGTALAEIIFGVTNPSAKLPFSWEKRWEDSAAYGHYPIAGATWRNDYHEKLLLGYRWFDAKQIEPLFPFGFGLSYTKFELTDLVATRDGVGNVAFTAQVRNTGDRAGAEVVQVYAAPAAPLEAGRPPRELKAFGKVFLQPGETRTLTMHLNPADLAEWDVAGHRWLPVRGRYSFAAGSSSRDLPLHADLDFD